MPEVDNFSRECYQALLSPLFLRREPGSEARDYQRDELIDLALGNTYLAVDFGIEAEENIQLFDW